MKFLSINPTVISRKKWIIFLVIFLITLLIQVLRGPDLFDDAYITFRYARNINQQIGFVYNENQPVLGTTTPLFTLLISLTGWLFGNQHMPFLALVLAIFFDTLSAWLLYRLGERWFDSPLASGLLALVFLFQPFRLEVARSGMEASFFTASILLMWYAYFIQNRPWWTGAWAGIVFLIRPDGVLAIAPLFLHWLWKEPARAVKAGVVAFAITAPWLIWATLFFGSPIPHSITAKVAAYHYPPGMALVFFLTFLSTGTIGPYDNLPILLPGLILAMSFLVWGARSIGKHCPEIFAAALFPLLYIAVMSIQNPGMFIGWYYPPLIPGLLLFYIAGPWFSLNAMPRIRAISTALVAAALVLGPLGWLQAIPNSSLMRAIEDDYYRACWAIEDEVQPGDLVLAPDIGVVGWCLADAKILDSVGLVSEEAIPYLVNTAKPYVSPQLVADYRPAYVFSQEQFLKPALLDDPAFRQDYVMVYYQAAEQSQSHMPIYVFKRKDH